MPENDGQLQLHAGRVAVNHEHHLGLGRQRVRVFDVGHRAKVMGGVGLLTQGRGAVDAVEAAL
jgi:hypothetical protein